MRMRGLHKDQREAAGAISAFPTSEYSVAFTKAARPLKLNVGSSYALSPVWFRFLLN